MQGATAAKIAHLKWTLQGAGEDASDKVATEGVSEVEAGLDELAYCGRGPACPEGVAGMLGRLGGCLRLCPEPADWLTSCGLCSSSREVLQAAQH